MRSAAMRSDDHFADRAARISVRVDATLIEHDGCKLSVVVTDVSSTGFRLESDAELIPGEEVLLQAQKRTPVRARVQWVRGTEAGGVFLDPVAL